MLNQIWGGIEGFMAEGPLPSGPRLVPLDKQEPNPNVKKLESRSSVASIAAIRATRDEGEDEMKSSRLDGEEQGLDVVELGERLDLPANSAPSPASFWARLQTGWSEIEDRLAEWFGFDQSRYQWAVDELLERQLAGDHPASKANEEGLQMQEVREQTMQRVSKRLNFEG